MLLPPCARLPDHRDFLGSRVLPELEFLTLQEAINPKNFIYTTNLKIVIFLLRLLQ
jgi:hypothetical protein